MPASASRANSSGIACKRAQKNTGPRLSIRKRAASASTSARGTVAPFLSVRKRPSGNSGTVSQRADNMETHPDASDASPASALGSLHGKVIERREQWLRKNKLSLNTHMNAQQKVAFLEEVKAEFHGSPDQLQKQEDDKAAGKSVGYNKHLRWNRETQRRGGTTQMWCVLSFSGRWEPAFRENLPAPLQDDQLKEEQKKKRIAAIEARAAIRYATKCLLQLRPGQLNSFQASLVARLRDGSLAAETQKLTLASEHGSVEMIGGPTGGFTRAVLYDWTPPDLTGCLVVDDFGDA